MNRIDKEILMTLCLAFILTTISACQTKTNQQNSEQKEDKLPSAQTLSRPGDTLKAIKENALLNYIAAAKSVKPNLKNGVPFDKLDYNKIIAYDFAGSEEPYPGVIDRKGKFVPVVLAQQFLTQEQADKILATLTSKSTYGEATAACFHPHFALVLYKNNKMIHQINICLDCNYLISSIPIPAESHKKVNAGQTDEYAISGFTESGQNAIINLCKQLNFTYGQREHKSKK